MSDSLRFYPSERGKIAAITTSLEMHARPPLRPSPDGLPGEIVALSGEDGAAYLDLYRKVGAPHLWFSRLYMDPAELSRMLRSAGTLIFAYRVAGADEGLLELDFSGTPGCEIKYFGVTERLQGTGAARRLMNHAIETAFERGASRLWLHTNTIDHPRALAFYRRTGFVPFAQEIELADDPRLRGVLPRDAAPHVPIFE